MPCYDPRPDMETEHLKEELNRLTQLLCEACKFIHERQPFASPELLNWKAQHERWDKQRGGDSI